MLPAGLLIQSDIGDFHICCKNWLPSSVARGAEREFLLRKVEKYACTTPSPRHLNRPQAAVLVAKSEVFIPKLLAVAGAAQLP